MAFKNTHINYKRSKEATKWLEEEIAEQLERYKKIVAHMEEISEERDLWYEEFFSRIKNSMPMAII